MDELPVEILKHILHYLSQRNLFQCSIVCKKWYEVLLQPSFYATVELYSYQQLKKYIKTATKKEIHIQNDNSNNNDNNQNHKLMIYYTQHLNIYFDMIIFYEAILEFISAFPNLLSINSFGYDITGGKCINKSIPQLEHLLSIPFWYNGINKEYITNSSQQKSKLKSLSHTIQPNENNSNEDNEQCIYLNPVGPVNSGKAGLSYYLFGVYDIEGLRSPYQCKILILPTFESLTSLKISFTNFQSETSINEYDERLIESIHPSCPKLETLQLDDFYMNISNEFDTRLNSNNNNNDNNNNNNLVTFTCSRLKEFKVEGALRDPRCFIYLSLKYPHLESFTLKCNKTNFLGDDLKIYQLPIYEMITHYFGSLKQLTIYFATGCYPENDVDEVFWPKHNFTQWLNNHPKQLTHLAYPDSLYPVEWKDEDSDSESDNDNDEWLKNSWKNLNDSITKMTTAIKDMNLDSMNTFYRNKSLHGGNFLKYLTSLSLRFEHIVDTATTFLLLHGQHAITVSNSITELKIHSASSHEYLYFYDWLDLFPNMTEFHLKRIDFLIFDKEDDDFISFHRSNEKNGNYLHYLIKQRKSQRDEVNNNNNNNGPYQLKKLILEGVSFCLKNGFNSIFQKLTHLNSLTLAWIYYSPPEWCSDDADLYPFIKNIYINLPHSYLDYLSIYQFRIVPWVDPYSDRFFLVDKLIVNEALSRKQYTVNLKNVSSNPIWIPINDYQYTLHLVAKYVDKLIF
ncbi:unnamed protein product [Cunninghamella blakesleeana]